MWLYFHHFVMTRAAWFWCFWSWDISSLPLPNIKLLQQSSLDVKAAFTSFSTAGRSRYFRILQMEYTLKFIDLHTFATWSLCGCYIQPLGCLIFLLFVFVILFQGNPCLLTTLRNKNGGIDFHDVCRIGYHARSNPEHFWGVAFFYYIPDPCLLAIVRKTGEKVFMQCSEYARHDTTNKWHDCFTPESNSSRSPNLARRHAC